MILTSYEDLFNTGGEDLVRDQLLIDKIKSFTYQASIQMSVDYHNRIDLISYDSYGTVDLWYMIAIYNGIVDPFDFNNDIILIPSITEIQNFLVDKLIQRNNI